LGEYTIKVELYTGPLVKEKAFKIIVKKNQYIASLETLQNKLSELESTLNNYQTLGMSVGSLDNRIEQAKKIITDANAGIQTDNLNVVKASVTDLERMLNSMTLQVSGLKIQKTLFENRWNISGCIMILFISTYLITEIICPYHTIGKEIKVLTDFEKALVKARIETETQYFARRIDEITFRTIMTNKQAEILKVKGQIKQKQEDKSNLMKTKLHPFSLFRWIKNGFIAIGRSIKSSLRRTSSDKNKELETPKF